MTGVYNALKATDFRLWMNILNIGLDIGPDLKYFVNFSRTNAFYIWKPRSSVPIPTVDGPLYCMLLPESLQSSLLNEFVFQKGYLINHKKDTQMNKNIKQCIEYNLSTIRPVV